MADITSQDADLKQETPDVIAEVSTSDGASHTNPDPQLPPSQGTRSNTSPTCFAPASIICNPPCEYPN